MSVIEQVALKWKLTQVRVSVLGLWAEPKRFSASLLPPDLDSDGIGIG